MKVGIQGVMGFCIAILITALLVPVQQAASNEGEVIRVGSKNFGESYILAEIATQVLEAGGFEVERRTGLGGTLIAFEALQSGSIDLYPEYTGTLSQAILQQPGMTTEQLATRMALLGLELKVPLGFENSYAIAVARDTAEALHIARISDLASHPDLRISFSHEFLSRGDGWPALSEAYGLPHQPGGIEHALAYRAAESGHLQVTDAYTTDGELDVYALRLLEDDRNFFPAYDAFLLSRSDLPGAAAEKLMRLSNRIDEATMRALNRRVANQGEEPAVVAAAFLREAGLVKSTQNRRSGLSARLLKNTRVHLKLTGIALLLACLVAIPLALVLAPFGRLATGLAYVAGLIQTIPALALLALMIPLVGLGQVPAILALFLYSLLPIVRNTLTGIFGVDPLLKQVATGLGLTRWQQMRRVELPLAMPTILTGIKTAAIISVGTATLAAFVGAGGLGEPIITGLALNDHRLILEGAIPAAGLAIVVELLFEVIERATIPAHLRS